MTDAIYNTVLSRPDILAIKKAACDEQRHTNVAGASIRCMAFGGWYLYDIDRPRTTPFPGTFRHVLITEPFSHYLMCQLGDTELLELISTKEECPTWYVYYNESFIGTIKQLTPKVQLTFKSIWNAFWTMPTFHFEIAGTVGIFGRFSIPSSVESRTAIFEICLTSGQKLSLTGHKRSGLAVSERNGDQIIADKVVPTQNVPLTKDQLMLYASTNIMVRVDYFRTWMP